MPLSVPPEVRPLSLRRTPFAFPFPIPFLSPHTYDEPGIPSEVFGEYHWSCNNLSLSLT
jgi:hypothetical protein